MADDISIAKDKALAAINEATKLQNAFLANSKKGSMEQIAAFSKMADSQKYIIEQNNKYLKSLEEIEASKKRQLELEIKITKAKESQNRKEKESLEKELAAEESLNRERVKVTLELKKKTEEQKKSIDLLTKEKGLVGEMMSAFKNKAVQQLAALATLGNALHHLSKLHKNVMDISVLSGNYQLMQGSYTDLVAASYRYERGLISAKVGLRFLGHTAEEVGSSMKEFTTAVAKTGVPLDEMAAQAALATETTGRLAQVLGVSLSDATSYTIEVQEKFGQTMGQTASALYDVYENTDKYNKAAGTQVLNARDVTKVMFDLARETKGVSFEQTFMSKLLSSNVLALQAQGKNYRESLAQASLYVKKMTTEAPNWGKVFSGKDLDKTLKDIYGKGGKVGIEALTKELKDPKVAKRISGILETYEPGYAREKLIQEALEGTKIGMTSMQKVVGGLIKGMDRGKASLTLQSIMGISATDAEALLEQNELQEKLNASKEKMLNISKLEGEEKQKAIEALSKETGIGSDRLKQISEMKDSEKEFAIDSEMQYENDKKAVEKVIEKEKEQTRLRLESIASLEKRKKDIKDDTSIKNEEMRKRLIENVDKELEGLKGPEGVRGKLEKAQSNLQGGTAGEFYATVSETLKSSFVQLMAISDILTAQSAIQTGIWINTGGIGKTWEALKGLGPKGLELGKTVLGYGRTGAMAANIGLNSMGSAAASGSIAAIVGSVAAVLGAAGIGVAVGSLINKGVDAYTTKESNYGQKSNIIERGIGKVFMSSSEYSSAYGEKGEKDKMVEELTSDAAIEKAREKIRKQRISSSIVSQTPTSGLPTVTPSQTGGTSNLTGGAAGGMGGGGIGGSNSKAGPTATLVKGAQGSNILLDLNLGQVMIPMAQSFSENMNIMRRGVGGVA